MARARLTPHERACQAIQANLLPGDIQELIPRAAVHFIEIPGEHCPGRAFILASEVAYRENRITHILLGNGYPFQDAVSIIRKAYAFSTRLLVLEHKPTVAAHDGLIPGSDFTALSKIMQGLGASCIDIDERNVLWVATNLHGWDVSANKINRLSLLADTGWEQGAGFSEFGILLFSSEGQEDGTLLTTPDRVRAGRIKGHTYCVCGGLMFLNLVAEAGKPAITLIDTSLKQLLYAKAVVDTIMLSPTLKDFDRNLDAPVVRSVWSAAVTHLMVKDEKRLGNRPTTPYWYNLVRFGKWRKGYERVRNLLNVTYHWGPIAEVPMRKNALLYASTVHPDEYADCKAHIIEARTNWDKPQFHEKEKSDDDKSESSVCLS